MAESPTELLYAADSYLREFDTVVVDVDKEARSVALSATAFFPAGGGQPHDTGVLRFDGTEARVVKVAKGEGGLVWHEIADVPLPEVGTRVHAVLDWERRYLLMRTHTALHVLNGVIWRDHGARVTGAHMVPGEGRLDFELPTMSREFAVAIQARVNEQVALGLPVRVVYVPRAEADVDPSLIRLKANLIPRSIDPLRVIDIVGLDRQADGGTHVASTSEIGEVRIVKTESKGVANKRVRIRVNEAPAPSSGGARGHEPASCDA